MTLPPSDLPNPRQKNRFGFWLSLSVLTVVLNLLVSLPLAARRASMNSGSPDYLVGEFLGYPLGRALFGPLLFVLPFLFFKRFRNWRSAFQIFFWISLLCLVGSLSERAQLPTPSAPTAGR